MMVSEEEFVEIIDRLREVNDFVDEVNDKARKLSDAVRSDFMNASSLSISHEDIVVNLLKNMFNDENDTLGWWLYEQDYGRKFKIGNLSYEDENGITVYPDLGKAEYLYEYLLEEGK